MHILIIYKQYEIMKTALLIVYITVLILDVFSTALRRVALLSRRVALMPAEVPLSPAVLSFFGAIPIYSLLL